MQKKTHQTFKYRMWTYVYKKHFTVIDITTLNYNYRISSNRSRGYYSLFEVQGEGINQGRALFEGGYYSKIGQNGLNLAKIDQNQPNLGLK